MRKPIRSKENAKISISLSQDLLNAIDDEALKQSRARSNMMQIMLSEYFRILKTVPKEKQFRCVAETSEHLVKP